MNQPGLDEDLAVREVLDDIIGMVNRRERLIESASQEAEETRDEHMSLYVNQLQQLMTNFLVLFEPVLIKVRAYAETLKSSLSESESFLRSLVGIIDAGKAVDGSSATMQELEKDADELEYDLKVSTETLTKIEDLFKRTRRYSSPEPQNQAKRLEPKLGPTELHDVFQGRVIERKHHRSQLPPVSGSRPTLSLTDETRARIQDLFNGPSAVTSASPSSSQGQTPNAETKESVAIQPGETKRLRPFTRIFSRPSADQPAQSND